MIDAFEAIESNGPLTGVMMYHRIAAASTDCVAADRVMVEATGVKPETVGHLVYCAQTGLGQYDLSKIDIRGERLADVNKSYRMPAEIESTVKWMRPLGHQIR